MSRHRRLAGVLATAAAGCALLAPSATAAPITSPTVPPVSTGHSGWAWGSPTPQGEDLDAVTFQGAEGYAVGAFGTVLRSTDGGQTWTGLASGTTDDLDLVQELDPSTLIAAGGCSAIESTDSGASFAALPLGLGDPCPDPVAGIAFSDPLHGYVELQDGTLLYTADGGATLQAESSPPLGGGAATGLAFSSPTTGLAVSSTGVIDRTTDGGNSWTEVDSTPEGLNGVTVVSPTIAYAVGNDGTLLSSTDGGVSWTTLPLVLQGGGTGLDLTSITCADASDCLIATVGSSELVRTSDGGQTGAVVSVSNDALTGVAYATGSTVVGVGALGATVISGDGGQTFPTVSSGGFSAFTHGDGDILRAGLAPGTAYLPGIDGIAATTDSGQSWSLLRVPTDQTIFSAAFTSAQTGYALDGDGVVRRTNDGGTSWRSFPGQHVGAFQLVAPTPGSLLMVGTHGILRSTDGGAEFRAVPGRVRVRGRRGPRVSSLDLDSGIAVPGGAVAWQSQTGVIVASSDAGRTWRSIPLPPHPKLHYVDVTAVSASRLWVYDSHTLWSTTNAGRTWQSLPALGQLGAIGVATDGVRVSFSSPRDGVVSLDATDPALRNSPLGQVSALRTTDGGRTWTPEIIAGEEGGTSNQVLATPTGDIAALGTAAQLPDSGQALGLFTTAGVPAPGARTTLRIRFATPRMSARALARAGHHILVTGRIGPVLSPDATVAVSYRVNGGTWRLTQARVATSGAFRLHLAGVRTGAEVVAQAVGTSTVAGAGTPVARFRVTG